MIKKREIFMVDGYSIDGDCVLYYDFGLNKTIRVGRVTRHHKYVKLVPFKGVEEQIAFNVPVEVLRGA
jgi:hypothetical protein